MSHLEHTRDHIDRRDTRSHLVQLATTLGARRKRSVLDLSCGHGHDRSSQRHAGGSRSEASTQGEQNKEEAVAQLATILAKQVVKNALEIRGLQARVIRGFHPHQRQRHGGHDQIILRRVRSPLLECFQREEEQNIVSPSVAAWIGLVRSTLSAPLFRSRFKQACRVHRGGTNMSELTEGVKRVKTRKAWEKNTVKLLLCVGPNVHSQ